MLLPLIDRRVTSHFARDVFLITQSQVRRKIGICDRRFMEANMVKFSRQILPAIKTLKANELSLNGNEKRVKRI